eukprot:GSA120T00003070001.1
MTSSSRTSKRNRIRGTRLSASKRPQTTTRPAKSPEIHHSEALTKNLSWELERLHQLLLLLCGCNHG